MQNDPSAACPQYPGSQDKFLVLEFQDLRPDQTCHVDPSGYGKCRDDRPDARRKCHQKQNHNDQARNSNQDFDDPLHDGIHASAEQSGDGAIGHADEDIDQRRDHRNHQGDSAAHPAPHPEIPAELVCAEDVGLVRKRKDCIVIRFLERIARKHRRKDRQKNNRCQNKQCRHSRPVLPEPVPGIRQHRCHRRVKVFPLRFIHLHLSEHGVLYTIIGHLNPPVPLKAGCAGRSVNR